jgi:hypothetical protein
VELCYIAADMLHFVEGEGYKLELIYELVVVENH